MTKFQGRTKMNILYFTWIYIFTVRQVGRLEDLVLITSASLSTDVSLFFNAYEVCGKILI
jgi:hypothetical protein